MRDPVDPGGLQEFSVVFTDRSLNHMSQAFQKVMRDLSDGLKGVYNADSVALVPGGGSYAMESVARQLVTGRHAFVLRNGWFSYRWSQIFDIGRFAAESTVRMARRTGNDPKAPFAPPPIEDVTQAIREARPDAVFAPHVETSSGIILPDDYIAAMAGAAHEVGAVMVLDAIASGCIWVDMKATGVDVLVSAPQKGWSSTPSAGVVMMSERGLERVEAGESNSFALDLKKWRAIMAAYEGGGHAYHATMPTDAIRQFRDALHETRDWGLEQARDAQWELGRAVRAMFAEKGLRSVAAPGFEAPGVVVNYTDDPGVQSGAKFIAEGVQIAAGVPLAVEEGADFRTFRIGLFGLDKLYDVAGTVERLRNAVDKIM